MDPFRLLLGLSLAQGIMAWSLGRISAFQLPLFLAPALLVWLAALALGRLTEKAARPAVREQVRALRRAAARERARTESMRGQLTLETQSRGQVSPPDA